MWLKIQMGLNKTLQQDECQVNCIHQIINPSFFPDSQNPGPAVSGGGVWRVFFPAEPGPFLPSGPRDLPRETRADPHPQILQIAGQQRHLDKGLHTEHWCTRVFAAPGSWKSCWGIKKYNFHSLELEANFKCFLHRPMEHFIEAIAPNATKDSPSSGWRVRCLMKMSTKVYLAVT